MKYWINYSSLFVDSFYSPVKLNLSVLPNYLQGLFRSTGLIVFMPYDIIGIILLLAILYFSRITFFLAIVSYYLGIFLLAIMKGSFENAYMNYSAFNFILTGIAIGGIFLIPSKRTYVLAFVSVILSVT